MCDIQQEPATARLTAILEFAANPVPRIELVRRSAVLEAGVIIGISSTWAEGTVTFALTDDTARPLAGAQVTLDGAISGRTDITGSVTLICERSAHEFEMLAPGITTILGVMV